MSFSRAGETRALLRAGALLPLAAPVEAEESVDTISARRYLHPALGDRPVIRLTPDSLASAEDLALDFLGFQLNLVEGPVARGRLQALGFPGWVLVHDPQNGAYALAVVKEMERLNRMARSRPGSARDGFEVVAQRLSRTTPHFLPTFYEQAGRAFIEAGNVGYAAGMFARAREAERIYSLEFDEQRRQQAFLEFALAGALTAKALQEYAEQLSQTHGPARAYTTFRELCIQRTLGGVPPWTGMPDQLRRMAQAAGLDPAAEEARLLGQLLETPATAGSPVGFWKGCRATLVRVSRGSPAVRGALLNLFPRPQRDVEGFDDWWLGLLHECGALAALCGQRESVPPEADVLGSPAAWLSKMATRSQRGWWNAERARGLQALLPRMEQRLRADGEPVDLIGQHGWGADLDLIDLALSLNVPLADPAAGVRLDLRRWSRQPPATRRSLQHLTADPRHGPLLALAVEEYLDRGRADDLTAASGLRDAVAVWLGRWADVVEVGGLVQLDEGLRQLSRATSAGSLALNPDARARILGIDIAMALAHTLRGGLLDELGWPALEEARAKLHPGRQGLRLSPAWPNLILSDGTRVAVVGPNSCLLEHDLRLPTPTTHGLPSFLYAGSQLLVTWFGTGGLQAYWSTRPAEVFDPQRQPGDELSVALGFSWELPDGGRTVGARAVHPGDTNLPQSTHMLSDGTDFWQVINGKLREYDPATGQPGRPSLPPFLDRFAGDGYALQIDRSWLMPLPPQIDRSPLGSSDGLIGWRVRQIESSGRYEGESIDGRTFSGTLGGALRGSARRRVAPAPVGLVTFPGDEGPERGRPLSVSWQDFSLWDADSRRELGRYRIGAHRPPHARGTPVVPPPMFWHCLQPRDPAGSLALRRLSDEHARRLLDSALEESQDENLPATRRLLQRLLPEVTHPELQVGILGAIRLAAALVPRLQSLDAGPPPEAPARPARDDDLRKGLQGLEASGMRGYGVSGATTRTCEQIEMVGRYMNESLGTTRFSLRRKDPMPKSLPASAIRWERFIGKAGALAYRAVAPGTSAEQRTALLSLLELWAETPFAEHPEWFRIAEVTADRQGLYQPEALRREGGHHYYLAPAGYDYRHRRAVHTVVEGSASGKFEIPADFQLVNEFGGAGDWDSPACILRFVELARRRGPMPWQPEAVEDLARHTGLSRAEAALLLAGLPMIDNYTHNFLPKELREMLGLKVAEAAAARQSLAALTPQQRIDLLAAAMPLDPAQLWEPYVPDHPDSLAGRMASAWVAAFGRRISMPDQLLARVKAVLPTMTTPLQAVLAAFTQPEADPRLNQDAVWSINPQAELARQGPDPAFDGDMLKALAVLIPWLFVSLPVGYPLREAIPQVLERARARLANWDLLVGGEWMAAEIQGRRVLDLVPGDPYQAPSGGVLPHSRDAGFLVAAVQQERFTRVYLRPAAVTGDDEKALLDLLSAGRASYAATAFLKGAGASAMANRVMKTPVPAGGWEVNPLLSAPHLVREVESTLALKEDAAALYLQILALTEPTARNLCTWNGWTAKRLAAAADTLVSHDLLVRAKRPRAGRDVFLPGPWQDLKAPDLPVESWKLSLYADAALGRMLPLRPPHELFAEAWSRIRSGDAPAFESVPEGRRR